MPEVYFEFQKALDYISNLYKEEDHPTVDEYVSFLGVEDFEPVIEDDIARIFKLLLKIAKPKKVLEIGMSIGFSTTSIALALKSHGGKVTTIEFNEDIVSTAQRAFNHFGVDENIEVIVGDAEEVLPKLEKDSFDVVFQDASKRLYPVLIDECVRVLKRGGMFFIDDTLFPVMFKETEWNESTKAIHRFNNEMLRPDLFSTLLPIGEGCTIAVKL